MCNYIAGRSDQDIFSPGRGRYLYIQQIPSPALVVGIYEEAVHYKIEANREQKREMNARFAILKVIRKFFLKHNKSFRWQLWNYEEYNFFPFEGL